MTHAAYSRLHAVSLTAALVAMLGVASPVARAAPLETGFGGPADFGVSSLSRNDDGSTAAIDLIGAFSGGLRFYGGPYTRFWVNNNGNITFSGALGTYTPRMFPIASVPMIAPYWGDVDTRNATDISGPEQNLVYYHLEPGRLVVTWYNVGYFSNHNEHRMNFQLILTNATDCGSGDFDVEFRYDRCEWMAGGASGDSNGNGQCDAGEAACVPAQAGFDAGNLMDYVALPGSFTPAILNLCSTSNVGEPGVWVFSVRSGGVVCREDAPCAVTGATGPCALGRTQCVDGAPVCAPITTPVDELCDAVDNDCNGSVDDAEDLCSDELTCAFGTCVPPCFEGSCFDGFTCDTDTGICIETACLEVSCDPGERCEGGDCVDACLGIVCPHGQNCVSGVCVEPCSAVTCEAGRLCREGRCVLECPCSPCPVGETCRADGSCVERGCDIVNCGPGLYCEDGTCHDSCEDVVCPRGQVCMEGACVRPPPVMPDAGPPPFDGGPDFDGGTPEVDAGTPSFDVGTDTRGPPIVPNERGCACTAAGRPDDGHVGGWVLLGLALVAIRRLRR